MHLATLARTCVLSLLIFLPLPAETPRRVDSLGDPLPPYALVRLGTKRFRSPRTFHGVAFTPDGKAILAGSGGWTLTFRDVATGKILREMRSPTETAEQIQFSKDGTLLLLVGRDGAIHLLDARTGAVKRTLNETAGGGGNVHAWLSPDGRTVAVKHRYDRQVALWDVQTGSIRHRLRGVQSYNPAPVLFTPDSKHCLLLWTDSRLHLVDVATGTSVRNLEPTVDTSRAPTYSSRLPLLALSPDGKQICYRASSNRHLEVLDLATGKAVRQITREQRSGSYFASGLLRYSPDGTRLIESAGDSILRIHDASSGKLIRELTGPPTGLSAFALSRDGMRVAAAAGHVLAVWTLADGKDHHTGTGHLDIVRGLFFAPDGKALFSLGDRSLRCWDLATGKERRRVEVPTVAAVTWPAASDDGTVVQWINSYDRCSHAWRVSESEIRRQNTSRDVPWLNTSTLSRDGRWMAGINARDRKLRLLDMSGKTPDRIVGETPYGYNNTLTFSPDGGLLAVAATDHTLTVYDVASGAERRRRQLREELRPEVPQGPAPILLFSPDGRSLLVHDGRLRVLEALTLGERQRLLADPVDRDAPLVWSANSRLLARGDGRGIVWVHDVWTGLVLSRRQTDQGTLHALAFGAGDRKLATGGSDTTILLWDAPTPPTLTRPADGGAAAWADLADADAGRAYRALLALRTVPEEAIRRVRALLRPGPPIDPVRIARLITDLDSDVYRIRERAARQLIRCGRAAEPQLKAATGSGSLERRRKAEDLLRRLDPASGVLTEEQRRFHRCLELMERIDTPAAREVLARLKTAR